MEFRTAAVLGLGLIGGSAARELAARGVRVLGHDHAPATLAAALRDGGIHAALGSELEGIAEADLVLLAVPVSALPPLLAQVARRAERARLVTDVGSTKASAVAAAETVGLGHLFVGSHPLAGDHRSGWEASRVGLFRGARVFLCPTAGTAEEPLASARALWAAFGAHTEIIGAAAHDQRLAWTSHLPQIAATALGVALHAHGAARDELGPGGQDTTRLAGSAPEMWTAISLDNAGPLLSALAAMQAELGAFHEALEQRDAAAIRAFFDTGRKWAGPEHG